MWPLKKAACKARRIFEYQLESESGEAWLEQIQLRLTRDAYLGITLAVHGLHWHPSGIMARNRAQSFQVSECIRPDMMPKQPIKSQVVEVCSLGTACKYDPQRFVCNAAERKQAMDPPALPQSLEIKGDWLLEDRGLCKCRGVVFSGVDAGSLLCGLVPNMAGIFIQPNRANHQLSCEVGAATAGTLPAPRKNPKALHHTKKNLLLVRTPENMKSGKRYEHRYRRPGRATASKLGASWCSPHSPPKHSSRCRSGCPPRAKEAKAN